MILGAGVLTISAGEPPARNASASSARTVSAGDASIVSRDQWYRVVLTTVDGAVEVPVFLMLPGTGGDAVFVTGEQRISARYERRPDGITVEFPVYHTRLSLSPAQGGALVGTWSSDSPTLGRATIPARATPIERPDEASRFAGANEPAAGEVSGHWRVEMGESEPAWLTLAQAPTGFVTGSIVLPSGSHVYLAGVARADRVSVSSFDGTSSYLLTAQLRDDGASLRGRWVAGAGLEWVADIRGIRNDAEAPAPQVELAHRRERLELPEPLASRYAGKPVVVAISASWCAGCADVVPVLQDLYRRHHDDGLELVTLTYEFADDDDYEDRQAALYKRAHDLPWEVVAVHSTVEELTENLPVDLVGDNVLSLPLIVFADANGAIESLQAGFPAPELTAEYERTVALYRKLAAQLVAR